MSNVSDGVQVERVGSRTLSDSRTRVQVEGHIATSPVVLGGANDAPLLGAVTLETLGLMVNPLTRELLPMRLMLAGATVRRWSAAPLPS